MRHDKISPENAAEMTPAVRPVLIEASEAIAALRDMKVEIIKGHPRAPKAEAFNRAIDTCANELQKLREAAALSVTEPAPRQTFTRRLQEVIGSVQMRTYLNEWPADSAMDALEIMVDSLLSAAAPAEAAAPQTPTCGCYEPHTGFGCELPDGHLLPHRAFINASDEQGPLKERRWTEAACWVRGENNRFCLFGWRHTGPHSFEAAAPAAAPPAEGPREPQTSALQDELQEWRCYRTFLATHGIEPPKERP